MSEKFDIDEYAKEAVPEELNANDAKDYCHYKPSQVRNLLVAGMTEAYVAGRREGCEEGDGMSEKFDAETRAFEMFGHRISFSREEAHEIDVRAMREAHAAGAREKAEEVAAECARKRQRYVLCKTSDDEAWTEGYGKGMQDAMEIARRHAAPPAPETREQRLERALREISHFGPELRGADACAEIARRALETK